MTRPASSHPPPPPPAPAPTTTTTTNPSLLFSEGRQHHTSYVLKQRYIKKTEPIALIPRVVRDVPIGSSVGR